MAKYKDRITLNECSKADLIWLINRILNMATLNNADWYLNRALSDLWYEKEKQRIESGEKYAKLADQKMREYADLLEPHKGKKLTEIPDGVLEKAAQLLKEAEAAEKIFVDLMQ